MYYRLNSYEERTPVPQALCEIGAVQLAPSRVAENIALTYADQIDGSETFVVKLSDEYYNEIGRYNVHVRVTEDGVASACTVPPGDIFVVRSAKGRTPEVVALDAERKESLCTYLDNYTTDASVTDYLAELYLDGYDRLYWTLVTPNGVRTGGREKF